MADTNNESNIPTRGALPKYQKVGTNIAGREIVQQYSISGTANESGQDLAIQEQIKEGAEKLVAKIDEYYDKIADTLHDEPELQEELLEHMRFAEQMLRDNEGGDAATTMRNVEFQIRRVHVSIARKQQTVTDENRLRWAVPTLVIFYIGLLVLSAFLVDSEGLSTDDVPILGIPIYVVIWAAVGSIASILYRFYKHEHNHIRQEIRWLIARPIIGVVMGAVGYLTVVSGLLIFGTATSLNTDGEIARPQLLSLLAFIGGFSDRFFEITVNSVINRFSKERNEPRPPVAE